MNRLYTSESFFNCSEPIFSPEVSRFDSVRGRLQILKNLLTRIAGVPLAFVYKLYRTTLALLGLGLSISYLAVTFCSARGARAFFVKRVGILANDLADWVLWPFAVLYCIIRLLLAASIHPSIYFHC